MKQRIYITDKIISIAAIASLAGSLFFSTNVLAATVHITSPSENISVGDVVYVDVRLDTQNTPVNVVEGTLTLQTPGHDIEMRELSVAGADLTLWPRKPSWSEDTQTITFVGGKPGGFNSDNEFLFRIFFLAKNKGEVTFVPDIQAYVNDGKGTLLPVTVTPLVLTVKDGTTPPKDGWRDVVASDNTPPEILSAEIGKDPSLYDGKLFLVIHSEDTQSGIDHFEVKEGERDPVRSGSEYVLQDQDQSTKITVTAIDKAGNIRILEISPLQTNHRVWWYTGSVLLVTILIVITLVMIKRRTKNT